MAILDLDRICSLCGGVLDEVAVWDFTRSDGWTVCGLDTRCRLCGDVLTDFVTGLGIHTNGTHIGYIT